MGAPLLVIGLDGATLSLLEPWAGAGELPTLARLLGEGAWGRLRSTLPAATFPAWTSLVTGVNPGRHGVLDFTERIPGTYRLRFVNGGRRRAPALWTRLTAAGRRTAVLTVPATFPPEPVAGVMVSGFDSPLATAIDGSFVYPPGLYDDIRRAVGRVPFADFQEVFTGPGWHARALAQLLEGVERRVALGEWLLRREAWDALMVVFGESDTVAHHFWRFHDPASPRHAPSDFADAVLQVYRALDGAIARLMAAAPPETTVAVVSDHGSGGASDHVVHLNRRLAECGLLSFRASGGGIARALRAAALRTVPVRAQGALLRRLPSAAGRLEGQARFGGIEWASTTAYSEELDYHPHVWLNVQGREPQGIVAQPAYEATRRRVARALEDWTHDGHRVVERVWRREELHRGPFVGGIPDLLLELAEIDGYTPSCLRSDGPGPSVRRLTPEQFGSGKGNGMNGAHRRDGVFLFAGPGVRPAGRLPTADIVDVLPTLLTLAGMPVPLGLDGRPIAAALGREPAYEQDQVRWSGLGRPVTDDGGADLAARLRALGYLEPEA